MRWAATGNAAEEPAVSGDEFPYLARRKAALTALHQIVYASQRERLAGQVRGSARAGAAAS